MKIEQTSSSVELSQTRSRFVNNLERLSVDLGIEVVTDKDSRTVIQFPNYRCHGLPLSFRLIEGVRQIDVIANPKATGEYLIREIEKRKDITDYKFTPLSPFEDPKSVGYSKSKAPTASLSPISQLSSMIKNIKRFVRSAPDTGSYPPQITQEEEDQIIANIYMRELKDLGIHYVAEGNEKGKLKFIQDPDKDRKYFKDLSNERAIFLPTEGVFGDGSLDIRSIIQNRKKIVEYVLSEVQAKEASYNTSLSIEKRDEAKRVAWRIACLRSYINKTDYPKYPKTEEPDWTENMMSQPVQVDPFRVAELIKEGQHQIPVVIRPINFLPVISTEMATYSNGAKLERKLIVRGFPGEDRILEVQDLDGKIINAHPIHDDEHLERLRHWYDHTQEPKNCKIYPETADLQGAPVESKNDGIIYNTVFRRTLPDGSKLAIKTQNKGKDIYFERSAGGKTLRRTKVINQKHFEKLVNKFVPESEALTVTG